MPWRILLPELLANDSLRTQDDLVRALGERGHAVTQATGSRELKRMGVTKVDGAYRLPPRPEIGAPSHAFTETLRAISESRGLNAAFSANGRRFFQQHYAWPVIEQKYLDVLAQLKEDDARGAATPGMDPEPGWLAKRRKELRAANDVLSELPFGPVLH